MLCSRFEETNPFGRYQHSFFDLGIPNTVSTRILCRIDYVNESPVPGVNKHIHLNNVTTLWRSINETLTSIGNQRTKVFRSVPIYAIKAVMDMSELVTHSGAEPMPHKF